ncbi:MAG: putative rane protein [Bryobacterales bacterium]|nr:putative rane protein [Bryobacterales bacterium]
MMPWTHRSFWIGPLFIAAILGLFVAVFSRGRLRAVYERHFAQTRRERQFLASVGFFTAVLVVRALTIAIHLDIGPFHDVSMRGRHIHHLVWGILLLLTVGYGWLLKIGTGSEESSPWMGRLMSMLFGVAAALTLDEFALWLNLKDVYWEHQGRESLEAMGLFGALLSIRIFGAGLFHGVAKESVKVVRGRE